MTYKIIETHFGIKKMYGINHPDWIGSYFDHKWEAEKLLERINRDENNEKL